MFRRCDLESKPANKIRGLLLVLAWGFVTGGGLCVVADEPAADETSARKAEREENMKLMLRRAQGTKIQVIKDKTRSDVELIGKPLFHYVDHPRRIADATLWGWTKGGRLVAVCKIEKYDAPAERMWLYCFGSLSTDIIDATWIDGPGWAATKPGVTFQAVQIPSRTATDAAGRLRQMKEISNRFEARILVDAAKNNSHEMRLLPRPIYRYEKPEGKILDGAVFGLTTNGTNPDAMLIIELHELRDGAAEWQFAAAGMTAGGVNMKLDGKEVWSKPFVDNAGRYDTWLWFFGKPSI